MPPSLENFKYTYGILKPGFDKTYSPSKEIRELSQLSKEIYPTKMEAVREIINSERLEIVYEKKIKLTSEMVRTIYQAYTKLNFFPFLEEILTTLDTYLIIIKGRVQELDPLESLNRLKKAPKRNWNSERGQNMRGRIRRLKDIVTYSKAVINYHDKFGFKKPSQIYNNLVIPLPNNGNWFEEVVEPKTGKSTYKIREDLRGEVKKLLEQKEINPLTLSWQLVPNADQFQDKPDDDKPNSYWLTKVLCTSNIIHTPDTYYEVNRDLAVILGHENGYKNN